MVEHASLVLDHLWRYNPLQVYLQHRVSSEVRRRQGKFAFVSFIMCIYCVVNVKYSFDLVYFYLITFANYIY